MSTISKHDSYLENTTPGYSGERTYIYLLLDPRNDRPFYVGKAKCVISRLGTHLSGEHGVRMHGKIEELKKLLLIPKVQILELADGAGDLAERRWILHYLSLYPDLCNGSIANGERSKKNKKK